MGRTRTTSRRRIRALPTESPEDPPVDQLLQLPRNSWTSLWVSNPLPRSFCVPGCSTPGYSQSLAANSFSYHFPLCNIGTDTGGSVRVPAAYCGIFGLRPSHGLVSTENVIPMSQMFDTVGRLLFLSFFLSLLLSVFMSYCCILLYEI